MGGFKNPYTMGQAAKILLAAWVLSILLGGGLLILSALANKNLCHGTCPWPFDTGPSNFWRRVVYVILGSIPVSLAVLAAGMIYYGRRD